MVNSGDKKAFQECVLQLLRRRTTEQRVNITPYSCMEYRQIDMKMELNANFASAFRQFYRQVGLRSISRRSRFDTHLETKDIRQSENIIEFILLELPSDTCGAFPWSDLDQYQ